MANLDPTEAPKSRHHIRPSVLLLTLRIVLLLFLIETVYAVFLLIGLANPLGENSSGAFNLLLLLLHTIKFLASVIAVGTAIFPVLISHYYISENQLISYVGLVNIQEKFFELSDMKNVKLSQSVIGKIFNYGSLSVEFSSSGFHEVVNLYGIHDPKKYEHILRQFLRDRPPSVG